jgi:hypothetical protein
MERRWRQWSVGDGGEAYVVYPDSPKFSIKNEDGTLSPTEFTYVEMPKDETAPYFRMECEYSPPDLVPRITAFHVIQRERSREVRSTDLRHIRLEEALQEAWLKVTVRTVYRNTRVSPPVLVFQQITDHDIRKTLHGLRSKNRRKITPTVDREVAEIWQADTTGAPTKAVADHFGLAPSTASLYVKRARDAGLLPPPPK